MAPTETPTQPGLKKAVLTPLETLAQSIAGIAPSATPGMLIPIVYGFSGNGTWLAYLLATVGIVFTAHCINVFASRSACPGSLYTFVTEGFGPRAGMITGWALLFAYIVCVGASTAAFASYAMSLCKHVLHVNVPSQFMMFISAAVVGLIAYRNVKLSTELMLWLELTSIGLITLIAVLTLGHHNFAVDTDQFSLSGVTFDNVRMGLVMAIFSFVAFESSASLGVEAKDPLKSIPRAIMQSVIFSGVFFAVCAYAMVMSFRGITSVDLAKCTTPLLFMSQWAGVPWLGQFVDAGIMMSFFAASLANLTAGARALYKMSHDGVLWSKLSNAHETNGTPHIAVATVAAFSLTLALILSFVCSLMDIVGYLGTLATFGYIYAYMATSVSAAVMRKREQKLTACEIFFVIASLVVLTMGLIGSVYPVPTFPYNILPYIFIAFMLLAVVRTYTLQVKPAKTLMGSENLMP